VIEICVLVPFVLVLGSLYGASGAAGAFIVSSAVFAAFWSVQLLRLHDTVLLGEARA
jgi:hypothetical protein